MLEFRTACDGPPCAQMLALTKGKALCPESETMITEVFQAVSRRASALVEALLWPGRFAGLAGEQEEGGWLEGAEQGVFRDPPCCGRE